MDSASGRLSAALLLTKNKGRDTIIKKNVKPEGSVPPWKTRGTSATNGGGEMGIPGLMDYNIKEIDEQYRKASDNIGE